MKNRSEQRAALWAAMSLSDVRTLVLEQVYKAVQMLRHSGLPLP